MEFKNGNLIFQGHPVVHNYVDTITAGKIKQATGEEVFTTSTRLNQEDWEDRNYKMTSLVLNNAKFDILKHSNVQITEINSNNSIIKIGENVAYIDGFDGENIKYQANGSLTSGKDTYENYYSNMKYQESITKGESKAQNIFVNSNFDLKTNSKLSLLNGTRCYYKCKYKCK